MNEGEIQVVMGTGPLGLAVARHLAARGEHVRAANSSGRADLPGSVEVVAANVANATDAKRVCEGATVIYHCANPPYARWPDLHPPLMSAVIEGAVSSEAKLVFGDNLYAYGPVDGPLTEDLPQRAQGANGRARAEIADALLRAHEAGRIRAAIGRGSRRLSDGRRLSQRKPRPSRGSPRSGCPPFVILHLLGEVDERAASNASSTGASR